MISPRLIAGRYKLVRQLGRGGMGEVWLALDERLDREVALKLLRDPLDQQHAARFVREARAVAALVHPNIVTMFDYGEEDGQLFIAMEYVPGEPLSETIRRRRAVPLEMRLRLIQELCAGLAHAHRRQIVHRDIKPANLMLAVDGRLRILDFGIARRGVSTLTQGHLLGSLNYMSPEQLALGAVDARSDIFAVGAVAYELLSYVQAFAGPSVEAVVARIRAGPEPLETVCEDLDRDVVRIVMKALEHDPARRFQDLAHMQAELERVRRRFSSREAQQAETQALDAITRTLEQELPPAEPPRRATDRESLERRRAAELRLRIEEARSALEVGDYSAAMDYAEHALVLDAANPEGRELIERATAGLEAAAATDTPAPQGLLGRIQARLIDRRAVIDYAVAAAAGFVPLVLAWHIDALWNQSVATGTRLHDVCGGAQRELVVTGYGSRANWWPYFAMLPFVLFMVRLIASQFFPLEPSPRTINRGVLLRIDERHRAVVGRRLAAAALDPRNLRVVLLFAVLINVIDVTEVAVFYVNAFRGLPAECPRELDWTVHFLSEESTPGANLLLTASAYVNQFVIHCLGMMLYGLLLRYNWFYLRSIYQRHHARRRPDGQQIVLDFNDVERCFGLRVLHSTFNLQIIILILGGIAISSTRVLNVDPTAVSEVYQGYLERVFPAMSGGEATLPSRPIRLRELFPDVGQVMLALAWVFCFSVVAMPSAVKFLPMIYKHVKIVGRKEYLSEFLPPHATPPLDTQEDLDALAARFARSSFWPAGDERARALYTFAYFVFFFVLVPVPLSQGFFLLVHIVVLIALSLLMTRLTFWAFRKALVTIDASLAQT